MARHLEKVRKGSEETRLADFQTGNLQTVGKALLGLDRSLQDLPIDVHLQVVQLRSEGFVQPDRSGYEDFVSKFMVRVSMWPG